MLARAARLALLLVLAGGRAVSALAAEDGIALSLPIDCEPGQSCWIMNYADTDPGPGAQDFACGPRTYDGHGGTDFGLRDLAAMDEGVAVLAAAPVEVIGVRDEMPDVSSREVGTDVLQGKLCGNGVRLDHGVAGGPSIAI